MKTLDEIKEEYAKEVGYFDFDDLITNSPTWDSEYEVVSKRYALEACKEALRLASENARVMTKNIDTENELEVLYWTDSRNVKFSMSKQSILSETNIPKEVNDETINN